MSYPRKIREIHQIEVTSRCNLACRYCPSPHLDKSVEDGGHGRLKLDMEWNTFIAAISLVKHFCNQGTQNEVALTGIGEPTMHPQFVEMVAKTREVIGSSRPLTFSTNGILLTDELLEALKPYNPEIYVSLHRPEVAGPAIERAKKYGLLCGTNASAATSSFNWAGQVDWFVSAPRSLCEYLHIGWGVVLADGRITSCCLDASGAGQIGTVWNEPEVLKMAPFSLCSACHMQIPEEKDLVL